MIKTVKGLVLRSVKYGENDKLITVLSEEGRLFFKARGIRSITSKNAAGCSVFVYSEFQLDVRGEKCFLRRATPLYSTVKAGASLVSLALASYLAELAEDTARDMETGKTVLRLLMNALYLIAKEDRPPDLIKSIFEMRLLTANGLMPQLQSCAVCGREVSRNGAFFFRLVEGDLVCSECLSSFDRQYLRISYEVVSLCRRSVESSEEKAYALRIPSDILKAFSAFTERYLTEQMEKKYKTAEFYREAKRLESPNQKEEINETV